AVPEIDDEQLVRGGMEVEAEEQVARSGDRHIAQEMTVPVEHDDVAWRVALHLEVRRVDVAGLAVDRQTFRVGPIVRKPGEGPGMLAVEAERGDRQEHRENQRL